MRRVPTAIVFLFVVGCGQPPQPAPPLPQIVVVGSPAADEPASSRSNSFPREIQLPVVPSAKTADHIGESLYLNITQRGHLIPTGDEGQIGDALSDPIEVGNYMKQRAKAEMEGAGTEKPFATLFLRIDERTPFRDSYRILKACRLARYQDFFIRVVHEVVDGIAYEAVLAGTFPQLDEEGNFIPEGGTEEEQACYAVRVTATADGRIGSMTFRVHDSPGGRGEPFGSDVSGVLQRRLTQLMAVARNRREWAAARGIKIPPPKLILEVDDNLLHRNVVQLFEAAGLAGFTDVSPVPIEPDKR